MPTQHHRLQIDTRKKLKSQKLKLKSKMVKLKSQKLEWNEAKDIKQSVIEIVSKLDLPHINVSRIFCFRTQGSKSRSYARIWSMPKIFQQALKIRPAYVIEVLSKHFDKLDEDSKKKVLIHELLHIPKNFSGALLPHRSRSRHLGRLASKLFDQYKKSV